MGENRKLNDERLMSQINESSTCDAEISALSNELNELKKNDMEISK
jgi:hypothetical protein